MPLVKKEIEGVKYGFAPLKLKELKAVRAMNKASDVFQRLDDWKPFIESSMQRAGSTMPDIDDMDLETAGKVFEELLGAVMEASGMKLALPGEAQPAAGEANGATSTASSSPLPAGL